MTALTRRAFVATVGSLAGAFALDPQALGDLLSRRTAPADVGSTLDATVLQGTGGQLRYRTLTVGPGEPYLPRLDLLGRTPGTGRASSRRSLLYLGHLSDLHVIDAQSPGRIEPMIVQDHAAWGSAFHPQDPLTVHVTASMVQSMSDLRFSPLAGAGPDGAVPDMQYQWLRGQVARRSGRTGAGADLQPLRQRHRGEPGAAAR